MIMDCMHGMEERLTDRIDGAENSPAHRIDLFGIRVNINRMECNLSEQVDAINKGPDSIEIEQLPKRVKRIEEHLQLTA